MNTQETTKQPDPFSNQTIDQYSRAIKEAIDMQLASIRYAAGKVE